MIGSFRYIYRYSLEGKFASKRFGQTFIRAGETSQVCFARYTTRVSIMNLLLRINRLTANRMLRIRKVIQYLADKISISLAPECIASTVREERIPGSLASHFVDLYCNGKVILFLLIVVDASSNDTSYGQVCFMQSTWARYYILLFRTLVANLNFRISLCFDDSFLIATHNHLFARIHNHISIYLHYV